MKTSEQLITYNREFHDGDLVMVKGNYSWYKDFKFGDTSGYSGTINNLNPGIILRCTGHGKWENLDRTESYHGCGDIIVGIVL